MSLLDVFLTVFHLAIILFAVAGWIHPKWRKYHLIILALILISWLGIGWALGTPGYCFLTDWHWDIKRELGEGNLPNSFTKYVIDAVLGIDSNSNWVDAITVFGLVFGIGMSVYMRHK